MNNFRSQLDFAKGEACVCVRNTRERERKTAWKGNARFNYILSDLEKVILPSTLNAFLLICINDKVINIFLKSKKYWTKYRHVSVFLYWEQNVVIVSKALKLGFGNFFPNHYAALNTFLISLTSQHKSFGTVTSDRIPRSLSQT